MADLSTLSDAEREVLLLLADGHTAKSAAARLCVSVNTVNERLRSARSKASVGSSRELARLVRESRPDTQETWPNEIGVAHQAGRRALRTSQPILTMRIAITRATAAMTIVAIGTGTLALLALSGTFGSAARSAPSPHVVSTYPAPNSEVTAGKLTLRVTFDRPMRAGSYSFVMHSPETYPNCSNKPVQSADGRSFNLDCIVKAKHAYDIDFNSPRFQNFVAAADDMPAVPATLHFSTR